MCLGVERSMRAAFVLHFVLMTFTVLGSDSRVWAQQGPEDQSPYAGTLIEHPEELSGLWEAPDGRGGWVGIHLGMEATAPAKAATLEGTEKSWVNLQVGVFELAKGETDYEEMNRFSDSPRGGNVRYEDGRLMLHFASGAARAPIDLDLRRVDGDAWAGRFHRNSFDEHVVLHRPGALDTGEKSWAVGTWRQAGKGLYRCLHVAQQAPGEYVGWLDSLSLMGPGQMCFTPHSPRPATAFEIYGAPVRIGGVTQTAVSFEENLGLGGCCPYGFTGARVGDGSTMSVSPAFPPRGERDVTWKKMPGDTCDSSEP
jgi:hypothetical protein